MDRIERLMVGALGGFVLFFVYVAVVSGFVAMGKPVGMTLCFVSHWVGFGFIALALWDR